MIPKFLLALLFWQTALLVQIGAPADPDFLRFQRTVDVPGSVAPGGVACLVLDANVLAHAAVAGAGDLRLYRGYGGSPTQAEVPYQLTESGPEPVDAANIRPTLAVQRGAALQLEFHMPPRAYSELRLRLDARALHQDFIGTVLVTTPGDRPGKSAGKESGKNPGKSVSLGNFGILDLGHAGLGHWSTLLLAETAAPVLHLSLTLRTPAGKPIPAIPPGFVESLDVPPSRERQTLYTPVASTTAFRQEGDSMVASLHVPAHVPIEALQFALQSGPHPNFAREVVLTARTEDDPFNEPELLDAGLLENLHLPSGDARLNPISLQETSFPATLGATLASAATVRVAIENRNREPLPLASATLAMRERRLCFPTAPGAVYTLRYGDSALRAPFYAESPVATATTPLATLGPESRNPHWTRRRDTRPFFDRHPELFWILVLACTGMMGGTALQFVQHRAEGTRR